MKLSNIPQITALEINGLDNHRGNVKYETYLIIRVNGWMVKVTAMDPCSFRII